MCIKIIRLKHWQINLIKKGFSNNFQVKFVLLRFQENIVQTFNFSIFFRWFVDWRFQRKHICLGQQRNSCNTGNIFNYKHLFILNNYCDGPLTMSGFFQQWIENVVRRFGTLMMVLFFRSVFSEMELFFQVKIFLDSVSMCGCSK